MRPWSVVLPLSALLVAQVAQAGNLDLTPKIGDDQCIQGCIMPLSLVSFSDATKDKALAKSASCTSDMYLDSVIFCAEKHCSTKQVEAGWKTLQAGCKKGGVSVASLGEVQARAETVTDMPVVDCVVNAKKEYRTMIQPTEANVDAGLRTTYTMDQQMIYHHAFGWSLWILCGIMALAGILLRLLNWLTFHPLTRHDRSYRSELAPSTGLLSSSYTFYRKHLGLPALFGHKHGQPCCKLFSIPTRLQGFWIFFYVALNVIFCSVGYVAFDDNLTFPNQKETQIWYHVSMRTAIMGWYNMPLLWLLAGRNDFLLWITGCSFSTLSLFHRWAARMFTLEVLVHGIGHLWMSRARLSKSWSIPFYRHGVFALLCVLLLIPLSILPIRQKSYEVFLILHILFSVASLVLAYYHVMVTNGGYDPWVWTCVAIWAFDRLARYVRLSVLSYRAFTDSNAEAVVTGGEHGLIRLTVTAPYRLSPRPGQHYFIYNPRSLTPWENHPFTLASWDYERGTTKLHFLISVRTGATSRLRKRIKETSTPTKMRVLLEGPYGSTEPVERFEHVLFVAGGSGITAILPYLHSLRQNAFTRSIHLIWSVKNNDYTTDVLRRELAGQGANITIHVTEEEQPAKVTLPEIDEAAAIENKNTMNADVNHLNSDGKRNSDINSDSDFGLDVATMVNPSNRGSVSTVTGINVMVGRPDLDALVRAHVGRVAGAEKAAILSCGPGAMVDDLRRAVVDVYGEGEGQVSGSQLEYFEELFAW